MSNHTSSQPEVDLAMPDVTLPKGSTMPLDDSDTEEEASRQKKDNHATVLEGRVLQKLPPCEEDCADGSKPEITSLGGPMRLERDPPPAYTSTHMPRWWSAETGQALNPSKYGLDRDPFSTTYNALGGTNTAYYLVVPGQTKVGQLVYSGMLSQPLRGSSSEFQWRRQCESNSCHPKFWDDTVRKSANWKKTYENILKKHGIPIDLQESVARWGSLLVSDANLAMKEAHEKAHAQTYSSPPEFVLATEADLGLLNTMADYNTIPKFTFKESFKPDSTPRIVRVTDNRTRWEADNSQQEDNCAYIVTKSSLTDSGIPSIQTTLVLPQTAEDLEHVPDFIWSWFLPSATVSANDTSKNATSTPWENTVKSVLQKFQQMDDELDGPHWLVRSGNRNKTHWAQLEFEDKLRILDTMIMSAGQSMIDQMQISNESGFTAPKVRSLSEYSRSGEIKDYLGTLSMSHLPKNTSEVATLVKTMNDLNMGGTDFAAKSETEDLATRRPAEDELLETPGSKRTRYLDDKP